MLVGTDEEAPRGFIRLPGKPTGTITVSVIIRSRWWVQVPTDKEIFELLTSKRLGERRHLSVEEYLETYEADPRDVRDVKGWARKAGLKVENTHYECQRCRVVVSGPVAVMTAAFGTELARYRKPNGEEGLLRTKPIYIPNKLANVVEAVLGFSSIKLTNWKREKPAAAAGGITVASATSYTPQQFAEMYNFPSGTGKGQTIAIIEFGGGYTEKAVATSFEGIGIKADRIPNIEPVPVGDGTNDPGTPADIEVMLDLVVIGALLPEAKIRIYFAKDTHRGWVDALMEAVLDADTTVISISWGAIEPYFGPQSVIQIERALKIATLRGITVCCATGDHGTTNGTRFRGGAAYVWYPASSPYVLACGGTFADVDDSKRIRKESVWNQGVLGKGRESAFWATGGGVSQAHEIPRWQETAMKTTVSVNTGVGGRGVPDVAANAARLWNIGSATVGGTSAATPLWAALVARINNHLGRHRRAGLLNPLLYEAAWRRRGRFNVVTQGSNEGRHTPPGYTAGFQRWNACTGLGSPNGKALLDALVP